MSRVPAGDADESEGEMAAEAPKRRRVRKPPLRVPIDDVPRTSAVSDVPPSRAEDMEELAADELVEAEAPSPPRRPSVIPPLPPGVGAVDAEDGDPELILRETVELEEDDVGDDPADVPVDLDVDSGAPVAAAGDEGGVEVELAEHEIIDTPAAPPPAPPPAPPKSAGGPPAVPAEPPSTAAAKRRRPWFETFFSDDYLRTVRAPRPKEVARECDFITRYLKVQPGATILDVGCGLGLHAIELTTRGYLVVGLDLSLPMLSRAGDEAQDLGLKINFLHGDMREMNFHGAFDAVLCWGTTYGYFDDESNRQVLGRFRESLKPGGMLLLDVVNRDHVIRTQPNLVWFEGDGCVCMEETTMNYITSRLEVKRTVILDDGRQREKHYSIRLYGLHELGKEMHQQGFRVAQVTGHTATPGVFFGADSPRMMILAERRSDDDAKTGTQAMPPSSAPDAAPDGGD